MKISLAKRMEKSKWENSKYSVFEKSEQMNLSALQFTFVIVQYTINFLIVTVN